MTSSEVTAATAQARERHQTLADEVEEAMASAKREAIDTEAAQVGPNIATDIARRGAISDRNAALRELRKLDANPPATPLRPRPRATSWTCSAGA